MKYTLLSIIILFVICCTPDKTHDNTSLSNNQTDTIAQLPIHTTSINEDLLDMHFGQGKFIHGHLNTFSSEATSNTQITRANKIDSITWNILVEPNYATLNSPALNSFFMFSDQNDLYGYDVFTYQVYEHMEEPSIYLVLTDTAKKLVNHILLSTMADGCGGISGEMTTTFINDSTFTSTSNFGELEVGKNKDIWHYEKIVTTYKINTKAQFILIHSDTSRTIQ